MSRNPLRPARCLQADAAPCRGMRYRCAVLEGKGQPSVSRTYYQLSPCPAQAVGGSVAVGSCSSGSVPAIASCRSTITCRRFALRLIAQHKEAPGPGDSRPNGLKRLSWAGCVLLWLAGKGDAWVPSEYRPPAEPRVLAEGRGGVQVHPGAASRRVRMLKHRARGLNYSLGSVLHSYRESLHPGSGCTDVEGGADPRPGGSAGGRTRHWARSTVLHSMRGARPR